MSPDFRLAQVQCFRLASCSAETHDRLQTSTKVEAAATFLPLSQRSGLGTAQSICEPQKLVLLFFLCCVAMVSACLPTSPFSRTVCAPPPALQAALPTLHNIIQTCLFTHCVSVSVSCACWHQHLEHQQSFVQSRSMADEFLVARWSPYKYVSIATCVCITHVYGSDWACRQCSEDPQEAMARPPPPAPAWTGPPSKLRTRLSFTRWLSWGLFSACLHVCLYSCILAVGY